MPSLSSCPPFSVRTTVRKALYAILLCIALSLSAPSVNADVIVFEGFEDGDFGPLISIETTGIFMQSPGITNLGLFGSNREFGFGISNCVASCLEGVMTSLIIRFPTPTFIGQIVFKESEPFYNWGSLGKIFVDGVRMGSGPFDFGAWVYDPPDVGYREHVVQVSRVASELTLRVEDITSYSQIYLDDLEINDIIVGDSDITNEVPEPGSLSMLVVGALLTAWRICRGRGQHQRS